MRYHEVEEWESRLKRVFDRVDDYLEEKYGNRYPLHPARPARGATSSKSQDGSLNGTVSVGNELPGAGENGEGSAGGSQASSKNEEVVNYEISKITKTEITEAGRIKRLSVAVLVDGVETIGEDVISASREESGEESVESLREAAALGFQRILLPARDAVEDSPLELEPMTRIADLQRFLA
mgnify:CR=1 FL=1